MIKLGERYRDMHTGFIGVAMCKTEYLYGCTRVGLLSPELKDGKPLDWVYFDEQSLGEVIEKPGGSMSDPPTKRNPN